MRKKSKRMKYIEPPMKFNIALSKFEPDLPLRKARLKNKKQFESKFFWVILFAIILFLPLILIIILLFYIKKLWSK